MYVVLTDIDCLLAVGNFCYIIFLGINCKGLYSMYSSTKHVKLRDYLFQANILYVTNDLIVIFRLLKVKSV